MYLSFSVNICSFSNDVVIGKQKLISFVKYTTMCSLLVRYIVHFNRAYYVDTSAREPVLNEHDLNESSSRSRGLFIIESFICNLRFQVFSPIVGVRWIMQRGGLEKAGGCAFLSSMFHSEIEDKYFQFVKESGSPRTAFVKTFSRLFNLSRRGTNVIFDR